MGKHEPMTAKAIANKIKAKGLQKIKYYCEMCKKQCRDDNGFKCHIMSESHQRQALIVCENPEKFVSDFSKQFMEGFMYILRTRYRFKRVLANTIFQEYIKERDHIHMNGTRWTTLTEFANWLHEQGHVKVEDSERGVLVTYIDRDPETLRRKELEVKRAQQAKEAAERNQKEIERQREATKQLYEEIEREKPRLEPKPIEIVTIEQTSSNRNEDDFEDGPEKSNKSSDDHDTSDSKDLQARPVFNIQPIAIKAPTTSGYKPPPPKKRVKLNGSDSKRKKI